jgi:hypothetical protein
MISIVQHTFGPLEPFHDKQNGWTFLIPKTTLSVHIYKTIVFVLFRCVFTSKNYNFCFFQKYNSGDFLEMWVESYFSNERVPYNMHFSSQILKKDTIGLWKKITTRNFFSYW